MTFEFNTMLDFHNTLLMEQEKKRDDTRVSNNYFIQKSR